MTIAEDVFAHLTQGERAVVVASPPGGGKSTLLVEVATRLAGEGLRVAVATRTSAQAQDLATRFVRSSRDAAVTLMGKSSAPRPSRLPEAAAWANRPKQLEHRPGVVVATAAKWLWTSPDVWSADVLMVDEAWQQTWADLGALLPLAEQLLLVGDPGQIGPVITGDISRWEHSRFGPHLPAPEVLSRTYPETVQLSLPASYRCGPLTVSTLQSLYDFPFESRRRPAHLEVDGKRLPELAAVAADSTGDVTDPGIAATIADHVRTMARTAELVDAEGRRRVTPSDIAVVCAHVSQTTAVRARLTDLPAVEVATADQFQGQEAAVVVAWSPVAAKLTLSEDFDLDPGRLCVMLSRHTHHLLLVERTDSRRVVEQMRVEVGDAPVDRYLQVLEELPLSGVVSPKASAFH